MSRVCTEPFSFTAAEDVSRFRPKLNARARGAWVVAQERRMRRHHSASSTRRLRDLCEFAFGRLVFSDPSCQPGISDARPAWWWRAGAAATAPPPCCKPGRPAMRNELGPPTAPARNKGGTRARARAVLPRCTAQLDRVRASHPLLSVSLRQSPDGPFIPRGGEGTPQFRPPDADLPACGDEIALVLTFLLCGPRACAGHAASTRTPFRLERATRCAAPRRARGDRGWRRRRLRDRRGAGAPRANRARKHARRATSSGSAPHRRLRRHGRPRR